MAGGSDPPRDGEDHGDRSEYTVVAVRVRPLDTAGHRGGECILSVDTARGAISCGREKFCFSSVFSGEEDNAKLFEAVGRPLVGAALLGYNGTLIAYGQTGSGKTYTIGEASSLGTAHEGVAHRMVRDLFAEMRDDFQHRYEVSMTAVQIHLESIFDLLGGEARECGHAAHRPLLLREDRAQGPYVEGARSLPCATVDEALSHMRSASRRLAFAATQSNAHSSRSHAICQLTITKNRPAPQRSARSLGGAPAARVRSELGPSTLRSSVARLTGAGDAAQAWRPSLQPHAPRLPPRAPRHRPSRCARRGGAPRPRCSHTSSRPRAPRSSSPSAGSPSSTSRARRTSAVAARPALSRYPRSHAPSWPLGAPAGRPPASSRLECRRSGRGATHAGARGVPTPPAHPTSPVSPPLSPQAARRPP